MSSLYKLFLRNAFMSCISTPFQFPTESLDHGVTRHQTPDIVQKTGAQCFPTSLSNSWIFCHNNPGCFIDPRVLKTAIYCITAAQRHSFGRKHPPHDHEAQTECRESFSDQPVLC